MHPAQLRIGAKGLACLEAGGAAAVQLEAFDRQIAALAHERPEGRAMALAQGFVAAKHGAKRQQVESWRLADAIAASDKSSFLLARLCSSLVVRLHTSISMLLRWSVRWSSIRPGLQQNQRRLSIGATGIRNQQCRGSRFLGYPCRRYILTLHSGNLFSVSCFVSAS